MSERNPGSRDPQQDILEGKGAFGVDYVPKSQRAKLQDGKVLAGKVGELQPGQAKAIHLERFSIALFRSGDEFYAIKDACPHADYPLSKGLLESQYVVMCNSHNWRFDIRDGRCVKKGICGGHPHDGDELKVRTFPVEVVNDEIWIRVG